MNSLFAGATYQSHGFPPQPGQEPSLAQLQRRGVADFSLDSPLSQCPSGPGWPASAHSTNRTSNFFFLAVSVQRGITHIPADVLKPLQSSEAQSPVEESSFPRNSWEKPPGQTSCLSVTGNQSYEKEGDWTCPAGTLEPFLACRRFSSRHRNVQKRSRETARLKRWQFQMAAKSNHDNDSSRLTQCYSQGSCIAASRCQLAGSVWELRETGHKQFGNGF